MSRSSPAYSRQRADAVQGALPRAWLAMSPRCSAKCTATHFSLRHAAERSYRSVVRERPDAPGDPLGPSCGKGPHVALPSPPGRAAGSQFPAGVPPYQGPGGERGRGGGGSKAPSPLFPRGGRGGGVGLGAVSAACGGFCAV